MNLLWKPFKKAFFKLCHLLPFTLSPTFLLLPQNDVHPVKCNVSAQTLSEAATQRGATARGRKRVLFGHKTSITSTITHEAIQNIKKTLCVSEGMHCVWGDEVYSAEIKVTKPS